MECYTREDMCRLFNTTEDGLEALIKEGTIPEATIGDRDSDYWWFACHEVDRCLAVNDD